MTVLAPVILWHQSAWRLQFHTIPMACKNFFQNLALHHTSDDLCMSSVQCLSDGGPTRCAPSRSTCSCRRIVIHINMIHSTYNAAYIYLYLYVQNLPHYSLFPCLHIFCTNHCANSWFSGHPTMMSIGVLQIGHCLSSTKCLVDSDRKKPATAQRNGIGGLSMLQCRPCNEASPPDMKPDSDGGNHVKKTYNIYNII